MEFPFLSRFFATNFIIYELILTFLYSVFQGGSFNPRIVLFSPKKMSFKLVTLIKFNRHKNPFSFPFYELERKTFFYKDVLITNIVLFLCEPRGISKIDLPEYAG